MNRAKLVPLVVETAKLNKSSLIIVAPPQIMGLPFIFFLLQTTNANSLVDTGVRDAKDGVTFHMP